MDLGTTSALNPTSSLTVSAWVKADSHTNTSSVYDSIYSSSKDAGGANGGFVLVNELNKWKCYFYSGTTWYAVESDNNVVDGQWYHLASTWDGTTAKLYVNGSVQTSTASVSSITYFTTVSAKVGSYYTGNYFNGLIDEVALFDSALSASDITSMYNSGVPNNISSLSPIGWWRMGDNDGGTGTTITDQGSGGNDGTLTNGPTFSTTVPPSTNTYSVDFDGTDDYLVIPDDPEFSMGDGLGNDNAFSISSWFKADSIGNFYMATKDAANREWSFRTFSSQLHFFAFGTGGGYIGRKYATNLSAGQWYHAVVTYDASKASSGIKLYLNGSRVDDGDYASGTYTAAVNTTTSIRVGSLEQNNTFADGKVDELAIFDSELSASDVTAIYNNGVPTDLASFFPVGWWRMGDDDGGTGTTITDQVLGGNDGTINGATFSTDVP